jgi:hypothetical protein
MKKKKVQIQTDEALFSSFARRCVNKAKRCDSITAKAGLRELARQYQAIAKQAADHAAAKAQSESAEVADRAAA